MNTATGPIFAEITHRIQIEYIHEDGGDLGSTFEDAELPDSIYEEYYTAVRNTLDSIMMRANTIPGYASGLESLELIYSSHTDFTIRVGGDVTQDTLHLISECIYIHLVENDQFNNTITYTMGDPTNPEFIRDALADLQEDMYDPDTGATLTYYATLVFDYGKYATL